MANSRALYEQVILEHNKKPRNFRAIEGDGTITAQGHNPLCGDQFTLYLQVNDDIIEDVSFEGSGCAISKSSASIMTVLLKGKSVKEAESLFAKFHSMITSAPDAPLNEGELGRMAVFGGVREFPIRIKCATLAWHTMLAALDGENKTTRTE
jgi:nitrogen fixation NifU-like protein